MTTVSANGHEIELSNPRKLMFPGQRITKEDLVEYYRKISEYILPWLEDRPVMLHRYPDGIDGKDFYQKAQPDYFPEWIDTIRVKVKKEGQDTQDFVNCNSLETLLYLASQATITPHIWLSKRERIENPERMVYDLDPPGGDFGIVRECAGDFKELFDELGLHVFLMTTGSRGLHLVLPLDGSTGFAESRQFARDAANLLSGRDPEKYTTEIRKEKRRGRLFLDYLRNSYGQTTVAPYALRAREGAPVATPVDWDEIGNSKLDSKSYRYANIFRRIGKKEDPWKDFYGKKNSLGKARDKLDRMIEQES